MAELSKTREIFEKVDKKIKENPQEYTELGAVYKFVLDGPEGGTWVIDLRKDTIGVRESDEEANCTFETQDVHFIELFNGSLPPENAFVTGKVKLSGDVLLAVRFGELLKR